MYQCLVTQSRHPRCYRIYLKSYRNHLPSDVWLSFQPVSRVAMLYPRRGLGYILSGAEVTCGPSVSCAASFRSSGQQAAAAGTLRWRLSKTCEAVLGRRLRMRWLWQRIQRQSTVFAAAVVVIVNLVAFSGVLHLSDKALGGLNA